MKNAVQKKTRKNVKNKKLIIILSIILLLFFCVLFFIFTNSSHHNQLNFDSIFGAEVSEVEGIDVSSHNGEIDWDKVSKDTDFAFIRIGYRGYSTGEIVEDKNAKENLKNANEAGIPVGIYFYSQAISVKEAEQEAEFSLDIAKKYKIDLPIVIDFEYPSDSDGNNIGRLVDANLTNSNRTDIVNAFCDKVSEKGYIGGVYAASYMFQFEFNTSKINDDALIWAADYNKTMKYPISYNIRQYTKSGSCDGVNSKKVDKNTWYLK